MNIIVPDMTQNALTGAMTVDQAADDAAKKGQGHVMARRGSRPSLSRTRPAALALPVLTLSPPRQGLPTMTIHDRRGLTLARQLRAFVPACFGRYGSARGRLSSKAPPAIVVMLIVIAYPIYYTVELSLFKTPPGLQLKDKSFIGLDNYFGHPHQ